jgi:hypothetical protein
VGTGEDTADEDRFAAARMLPPLPIFAWESAIAAGLLVVLLLGVSARSSAYEAISQEEPTPASGHEVGTPLGWSFVEKPTRPGLLPWLKDQLSEASSTTRSLCSDHGASDRVVPCQEHVNLCLQ